jgi:hypothetical protein
MFVCLFFYRFIVNELCISGTRVHIIATSFSAIETVVGTVVGFEFLVENVFIVGALKRRLDEVTRQFDQQRKQQINKLYIGGGAGGSSGFP